MRGIDKVIYINLERRPDRDENIRSELRILGVPDDKIVRFNAIDHPKGYIGCAQSHRDVLMLAEAQGWGNVLILEDDIAFKKEPTAIENANTFLSMLWDNPWDVAMLSGNYFSVQPLKCCRVFLRVFSAYCACAYLVNQHYRKKLLDHFCAGVRLLEKTNDQIGYSVDAHWLALMYQDLWFGVYPCLGYQRRDMSDIQKGLVNYEDFFFKPLSKIQKGLFCPAIDSGKACISPCYFKNY